MQTSACAKRNTKILFSKGMKNTFCAKNPLKDLEVRIIKNERQKI